MAEFTFNIEEHLLTLSENDKGWTKELNRVSFNGAEAKWISARGVQTIRKWGKALLLLMKNLKPS